MYTKPNWHSRLPTHALFPEWLGHEGSLTTRLVNTGTPFRLCLDRNITDLPSPDKAHALGILADCPVIAQEVRLTLTDCCPFNFLILMECILLPQHESKNCIQRGP